VSSAGTPFSAKRAARRCAWRGGLVARQDAVLAVEQADEMFGRHQHRDDDVGARGEFARRRRGGCTGRDEFRVARGRAVPHRHCEPAAK
jgi:hypothetical protein